jgi:hypothetical protein
VADSALLMMERSRSSRPRGYAAQPLSGTDGSNISEGSLSGGLCSSRVAEFSPKDHDCSRAAQFSRSAYEMLLYAQLSRNC